MLLIPSICFLPFPSKTPHELRRVFTTKASEIIFDEMDEVVYLLAQLRKLYVNLNEHYAPPKKNNFFFPTSGAKERTWLIQLVSITS